MNVFDVLREKLKEKAEIYMREEEIQKSNPCYQRGVYGFKSLGYKNTIEIVNQVEQEYNNGWIPCSERLPDTKDNILICTRTGYVNVGYYSIDTFKDVNSVPYEDVIAWQPLPEQYKEVARAKEKEAAGAKSKTVQEKETYYRCKVILENSTE